MARRPPPPADYRPPTIDDDLAFEPDDIEPDADPPAPSQLCHVTDPDALRSLADVVSYADEQGVDQSKALWCTYRIATALRARGLSTDAAIAEMRATYEVDGALARRLVALAVAEEGRPLERDGELRQLYAAVAHELTVARDESEDTPGDRTALRGHIRALLAMRRQLVPLVTQVATSVENPAGLDEEEQAVIADLRRRRALRERFGTEPPAPPFDA
jgi:hypothetical protein